MLILQVVALTVAMSTGGGPGASSGSKDERVAAAYQQFEKQRHVEAALEFEALWHDFKEPRFLFNAAITRYTARHYAHAVAYLGEYLALAEVKGADRDEAKAQLEVAQREVTSVQAKVRAEGVTGPVSLSARRVSELRSDIRPPLPVPLTPAADGHGGAIQLDPGTWTLRAEAPGAEPAEVQVAVSVGSRTVAELTLKPAAQETGPKGQVIDTGAPVDARKAAIVSLGVGGGLVVVGAVVTGIGQGLKFGPAVGKPATECATRPALIGCSEAVDGGLELRSAGAAVLGVGVGAAISSVAWWLPERRRRTVWIVEAGVGGLALVGGIVGLVIGSGRVNQVNASFHGAEQQTWEAIGSGVKGPATIYTASSAILGLGVGLGASAALGFGLTRGRNQKADRVARTLRVGGAATPGVTGLSLAGRF